MRNSDPTLPPRLCILASPSTRGAGVYTYWERLVPHLRDNGLDVRLLTGNPELDSYPTPRHLRADRPSLLWTRRDLGQYLRTEQITHVITSIPQSDILYNLARNSDATWFVFAHGQPYPIPGQANLVKTQLWKRSWVRAARRADGILVVSSFLAGQLRALGGFEASVVPPAIPPSAGDGPVKRPPERELSVGFVGRLAHEKDPALFLDLVEDLPDVAIHIFGDGPLRDEVTARSKAARLHGFVRSRQEIYSQLDLLLVTSRSEGLSLAILEGSARGVLPVAVDVGGIREAIAPELHGDLLIPAQDREDIGAWRRHIESLRDKKLRGRLLDTQQAWVAEKFKPEAARSALLGAMRLG